MLTNTLTVLHVCVMLQIIEKRVRDIHMLLNSLCESDSLSPDEFKDTKKLLSDADAATRVLLVHWPYVACAALGCISKWLRCVTYYLTKGY